MEKKMSLDASFNLSVKVVFV